jgi:hypothetical protein
MELELPTFISCPPSEGTHLHNHVVYPPKNMFASIKNSKILLNNFFIFKKSEKEFNKLTFGESELVNREI